MAGGAAAVKAGYEIRVGLCNKRRLLTPPEPSLTAGAFFVDRSQTTSLDFVLRKNFAGVMLLTADV